MIVTGERGSEKRESVDKFYNSKIHFIHMNKGRKCICMHFTIALKALITVIIRVQYALLYNTHL